MPGTQWKSNGKDEKAGIFSCVIARFFVYLWLVEVLLMEEFQNHPYEPPVTEVIEMKTEGYILQASGGDYPGWPGEPI